MKNIWTPPDHYEFPILEINKSRKLKFQMSWLHSFAWLTYSKTKLGGYCKYCVIIVRNGGVGNQKLGQLVVKPFISFKYAQEVVLNLNNAFFSFLIFNFLFWNCGPDGKWNIILTRCII